MSAEILIVDDDAHIRDVIRFALEDVGMMVREASNGQLALREVAARTPDIVVLDIGMPELDGFETCKVLRRSHQMPILFLTARDDEIDRVLGFELGADDYVSKPFSPRELVLRIRAILARAQGRNGADHKLNHGALSMAPESHECAIGDERMQLTAIEFSLLKALMSAPERVLSRNQLIDLVYGHNTYLSDRTVDSHIRNIRQKALALGCEDVIQTVRGVGVKLGTCQA